MLGKPCSGWLFSSDGDITDESLEISDKIMILMQLLAPNSQEGQGLLSAAWKPAKENVDTCQCTLEMATKQLQLNLSATSTSQHGPQDQQYIPEMNSCGPLW